VSNLKSVALTILELLAFNTQKFRGSRDPGLAPFFFKVLSCRVRTLPGNTLVKFEFRIALTVLELLAFYAQKFRASRDPGHAPFSKNY